jgi:hypothetical protein
MVKPLKGPKKPKAPGQKTTGLVNDERSDPLPD